MPRRVSAVFVLSALLACGAALAEGSGASSVVDRDRRVLHSGIARVVDGDTLVVGGARVALYGIDAPEPAQACLADGHPWPCGHSATEALTKLVGGRRVTCASRERTASGDSASVCRSDAVEVNAWMVAQGHALAERAHTLAYVDDERGAQAAGRGLWGGAFVPPRDWRRGMRLAGAVSPSTRHGCRLARASASAGPATYIPFSDPFARARLDTTKTAPRLCTVFEMRIAGWRYFK